MRAFQAVLISDLMRSDLISSDLSLRSRLRPLLPAVCVHERAAEPLHPRLLGVHGHLGALLLRAIRGERRPRTRHDWIALGKYIYLFCMRGRYAARTKLRILQPISLCPLDLFAVLPSSDRMLALLALLVCEGFNYDLLSARSGMLERSSTTLCLW